MVYAIEAYQKVFIPGFRFLPTEKNRISWKLDKQIKKQLMNLIKERENYYSTNGPCVSEECPKDLLEVMIKASRSNCPNRTCILGQTKQKGYYCCCSSSSKITAHDTIEECKTIFFAGKHTTSNLVTWTTVLLAMHPQWQEVAREEVLRICGAHDPPTQHHIANLKTLDMITNESLRLYPPAVATIRRAKVDAHLGDLTIPSGTELLIPILAIHHDTTLWGQDAIEFNPSRFSKGATNKHPMTFLPFGLGARRCIGQNIAILQAKLAITMILQRFSFHLSPNYKHAPTVLMLLHPQYGAPIIFQKL
ncbi:hypothetical protein Leryth_006181 [Lithospermum erythrorhizon]|nr:hypothetical protein Leryth_006181 [Lithospermum erythrorhizon]